MQIHQFPTLAEYSSNDYIPVSHNGSVYKAPYSDLGAAMIESTSAVFRGTLSEGADLNTLMDAGVYRLEGTRNYLNRPYTSTGYAMLEVIRHSNSYNNLIVQVLHQQGGSTYQRFYLGTSEVWTSWSNDVQIACTMFLKENITSLTNETYTIVPCAQDDTRSSGPSELLSPTPEGGIKIGPGISKVLVSGAMCWKIHDDGTKAVRHARIIKNTYTTANTILWTRRTMGVGDEEVLTMVPSVANVTENDIIYLMYYARSTDKEHICGENIPRVTYFTVQVLG